MVEPIATPCIKFCRIVEDRGVCAGCGRTLAEIAGWSAMTPAQRAAIMDRLERPQRNADGLALGATPFSDPGRSDRSL